MKKTRLFFLGILLMLGLLPGASLGYASPRVVLVLVNRLTAPQLFEEFKGPALKKIRRRAALGLVVIRTEGLPNPEKICLGINAGNPVSYVNQEGGLFLLPEEKYKNDNAAAWYRTYYASTLPGEGLINPEFIFLKNMNLNGDFTASPGLLGDSLHKAGLHTGYYGNSDPDKLTPKRIGSLIATDGCGRVDFARLGMPGADGIHYFDPQDAVKWYSSISRKADFIVFDFGDFSRIDDWSMYLASARFFALYDSARKKLEKFLELLYPRLDPKRDLFILLSPAPPQEMLLSTEKLGAVMIRGPGFSPGLLRSSNTRTRGLILSYDLNATILEFLKTKPDGPVLGVPLQVKKGNESLIMRFYNLVLALEAQRTPIIAGFVYTLLVSLSFGAILYFLGARRKTLLGNYQFWLLAVMYYPLALLLLGFWGTKTIAESVIFSLGIVLALTAATVFISGGRDSACPVFLCAAATSLALGLDTLLRTGLSGRSLLGYSPILGARFYGLGNEYMGLLVGTTILAAALLYDLASSGAQKWLRWFLPVYYVCVAVVISHPALGANMGDITTTTIGFGISYLLITGKKINSCKLLAILGLVVILFGIWAAVDLTRPEPSHMGRAVLNILSQGPTAALQIIIRKVSMNWRLIQYSRWTWVLICIIVIGAILFKEPQGVLIKLFRRYPYLRLGLMGSIAAAVTALIFNDSGIVAAATTLLVPGTGLLHMVLETRKISMNPR